MLTILNPANEEVITTLEEDTPDVILKKFRDACRLQKTWAKTPVDARLCAIIRFRELLVEQADSLAETLTLEIGKPISQSKNELSGVLDRIDFFVKETSRLIGDEIVLDHPSERIKEKIAHEPLGVIANISAWNYPYFVGANVFIPALLTGNAVLYKPSEYATLTGLAIGRLLHEAGIPDGIFAVVVGDGKVGAALLECRFSGIFFTGSYKTGKAIMQLAADRLSKVQLELGGKDPVYVCEDVDIEAASASVADGAFYNTGQSCCSVERIYVHRDIYDPFLAAFVKTVKGFPVGDPTETATYIGPLARGAQIAFLEKQLSDAKNKGARILCGGKRMNRPGFFFEPTVLIDVNQTMDVMREETFGPLIGIQSVHDDQEAIALMNDTEYGLTASVYSKNQKRAEGILADVQAGTAYWNCCDRVSPRLPWSGRGRSGIGTTLSTYGIYAFVQPKAWHLRGV